MSLLRIHTAIFMDFLQLAVFLLFMVHGVGLIWRCSSLLKRFCWDPIQVFNYGKHRRDFTYIDDIVEGVICTLDRPATVNKNWDGDFPDPGTSLAPWCVYNIGNSQPVELLDYINAIEDALGKKADKVLLPLQPGDVPVTHANVDDLIEQFDYKPVTSVQDGIQHFVDWYRNYYKV